METAMFFSETPVLKGADAKRLLKAMENVKPLSKERVAEIYADAAKFESRRIRKQN